VKFATELASEAETDATEKTFNKARTLVIHIYKVIDLPGSGLLPLMADIPFIPVSKGSAMYQKVIPAYGLIRSGAGAHQKYIAFDQGIPECHEVVYNTMLSINCNSSRYCTVSLFNSSLISFDQLIFLTSFYTPHTMDTDLGTNG